MRSCYELKLPQSSCSPQYEKLYTRYYVDIKIIDLNESIKVNKSDDGPLQIELNRPAVSQPPQPSKPSQPFTNDVSVINIDEEDNNGGNQQHQPLLLTTAAITELTRMPEENKNLLEQAKYDEKSYNELRILCKERGLKSGGKREELIKRLIAEPNTK